MGAVGDSINLNSISISTTELTAGAHSLGVRVKGGDGFWSPNYSSPFTILSQIVKAKYFIDKDPGQGKGIAIAGAVGDSINFNALSIPTTGLSLVRHALGVRVKGCDGL